MNDPNSIYEHIDLVVDRIGKEDLDKLILFSNGLKERFESKTGIEIGTYLVGSVTYPKKVYDKLLGPMSDLDIMVTAHDRNYLKPSRTNSNRCPLTKKLIEFFRGHYMDEFLTMNTSDFDFSFDEIHSRTGKISKHRHRPNVILETPLGLPIHLTVQYRDPKVYGISMSRKAQLTHADAIAKETKHNNPFYIL